MANIFRLNRPCPCGSGKSYGDCCAGGKKTRTKKRKRKRPSRGGEPRNPRPFSKGSPKMLRVSEFIARFSGRFADAFNAGSEWLQNAHGESIGAVFDCLEVEPESGIEAPLGFLLRSFGLFRAERPFGALARNEIVHHVAEAHGTKASSIFDEMDKAHLGAWKVTNAKRQILARRVDGTGEPMQRELDLFTDYKWDAITREGIFVGWLIEHDDICMLFFAHELWRPSIDLLNRAAGRSAWGDGEAFREQDYEEDVLALLMRLDCLDTGREDSRVFLDPRIEGNWYLRPDRLTDGVAEALWEYGLRSPVYTDNPKLDIFESDDLYYCSSCDTYHRDASSALPSWSVDAALLVEDHLDEIISQLEAMRADCVPVHSWYMPPAGPRTLEYVLPLEEMLAMIGLDRNGHVDHPKLARAESYPIGALDIDAEQFRKAGFDTSWSIGQAQSWANSHADDELSEELHQAVEKHRLALRWVGIVDRHRKHDDPGTGPIDYYQLHEGLRRFMPESVLQTPLSELQDTGRGTWTRIEGAMREQGWLDAPVLRLEHLPRYLQDLESLEGVGKVSRQRLHLGLELFVVDWPEAVGHRALAPEAHADEAAGELSSGLDELDELF